MSAMRIVTLSSSVRSGFSKLLLSRNMSNGSWGSGKGSGGSSEGSIREAGGAFGKREAAKEEEYFRRLSAKQLETLKSSLSDEIKYHAEEIHDHELAIERHKKKLEELKKISE